MQENSRFQIHQLFSITIDMEKTDNFVDFHDFWFHNCSVGNIDYRENQSSIAGKEFIEPPH
jgi:hypothetical protein